MAYYLLLVSFIFIGLATTAYLAFGHSDRHFSTIEFAILTVFEIKSGFFEYSDMEKADRFIAPLFFTITMFLIRFILLNLFIAILADAYTRVRFDRSKKYTKHKNKLEFLNSLKTYWIENCQWKRKKDKKVRHLLDRGIEFPINRFIEGLRTLNPYEFAWRYRAISLKIILLNACLIIKG